MVVIVVTVGFVVCVARENCAHGCLNSKKYLFGCSSLRDCCCVTSAA
jgi:hypothetical protein